MAKNDLVRMIAERPGARRRRRRRAAGSPHRRPPHESVRVVRGIGSYLPAKILTNAELAAMVDTSDEWIVQRTGIRQRHIAAEGEVTSDLGDGGGARRRWRAPD